MEKYQKMLIVLVLLVAVASIAGLVLKSGITAFFVQRQEGPVGYAMTPDDLKANISVGEERDLVFYIWNGYDHDIDVLYTLDGNISEIAEIDAPDVIPYRIWTPVTVRVRGAEQGVFRGDIYVDLGILSETGMSQGSYAMGMNILMKMKKGIVVDVV